MIDDLTIYDHIIHMIHRFGVTDNNNHFYSIYDLGIHTIPE